MTSCGWSRSRSSICRLVAERTSSATGQIGSILLRKTEKVRQGTRVEFVCGGRAVRMARRDYSALSEAAALFSAKLWDVPEQIRKSVEESKLLRKQKDDALDQLAELMALAALHAQPEKNGRKIIVKAFSDRDISFAKLFAQKVTRTATPAIALVASTVDPPGLVFAQTPGTAPGSARRHGRVAQAGFVVRRRARRWKPRLRAGRSSRRARMSMSSSFCSRQRVQSEADPVQRTIFREESHSVRRDGVSSRGS